MYIMEVICYLLLLLVVSGNLGLGEKEPCYERVDTDSGSVCYFPFIYKDKVHSRCIAEGTEKPWCGLITEVTNTTEAHLTKTWDYCVIRTNGSATCIFPFTNDNVTYNECVHTGQDSEWCATSESNMSEWGYCRQPCVDSTIFCYGNLTYTNLCPPDYVIRVFATEIGKSDGDTCVAKDSDCRIFSERLGSNSVWEEIKDNCEFRRKCDSLDLGVGALRCTMDVLASYVKMTYHCELESDIYLCSANSLCLASYNISLLLSLGIDFCTSESYSNKTCRKSSKTISLHEENSCNRDTDIPCTPLTVSNINVYLGDVCVDDRASDKSMMLLECTTDSYDIESIIMKTNHSLCPNRTLPEVHHIESECCCNSSLCQMYEVENLEKQVRELCDWEETCSLQSVNVSTGETDVCDVNGTITIQTKVYHNCKRAIYECSGNIFNNTMCDFPSYVNVTSVIKGVSAYNNSCKPSADDVVFMVSEEFPQYYKKVLDACNGRTSCVDLKAEAANAYHRTNGDSIVTNYVVIEYVCEENLTDPPSTTGTSTESTSSVSITVTSHTPQAVETTQDDNTLMYIIIGAAAGAGVLLVLLIILICCCCCRSRNSHHIGEQINNKTGSDNVYVGGKTGEMQLDTVNALVIQEGSYEYIKDKDLLRKSVLEGAYQDMDAGETDRKQSVVAANAYQDVDDGMKKEMQSNTIPEKERKQSFGYAEYQDIESIKKKERESKLLAEQSKLKPTLETTIEEENPEKGPAEIYTSKESYHAPAEYAEVDASKKSIKVKPLSDVAPPDFVELTENPYYEGLGKIKPPEKAGEIKPPEKAPPDNAGAFDEEQGGTDHGKTVESKEPIVDDSK